MNESASHCLNTDTLEPFLTMLREKRMAVMVALGDSTTCNATFTAGCKQWPELLHTELRCHYQTQRILTVNAGMCGDTAAGGLARLDSDVLRFAPNLTIVSFGSNDASRVSPEGFRKTLVELVEKLRAGGSIVLVRTPPPVMELEPAPPHVWTDDGPHWRLVDIQREESERLGVAFVDTHRMWRELEKAGELHIERHMHDCVHPNEHGHRLIARQLAPAFGMAPTFHWERGTVDEMDRQR
ncbi:MAG: hypothetical protein GF331_21880 [Chitinivibrionales bacterium]|nr:hypothetical protein [Chitinivibrionales bacterium]